MRTDTASNIINDALMEVGMRQAALGNPYTSNDALAVLARTLLKALGRELASKHQWTHLQKMRTFSTVNGTDNYALPLDFIGMLHSTQWNRSTGIQLNGPRSPEGWQVLTSSLNGVGAPDFIFRVFGNRLYLHETPTGAETIAFEYQSSWWVQPDDQSAPTSETPTLPDDVLWFDSRLLVSGLKVKVLEQKGLASAAARNEFDAAYAEATGSDGAHGVLSLVPTMVRRHSDFPLTGWGQ